MATQPRTRSSRSSSTCEAVINDSVVDEAVVDEVDLGDKESRTAQAVASVLGGMSGRKELIAEPSRSE